MRDKIGIQWQPATATRIRTIIVEDSAVAVQALTNLLETHSHVECVGAVRNGFEGLKLIEQHEPDLVLADMEMPGLGGLALVAMLRKKFPEMRLIVISTHDGYVWQQLSHTRGADAFVTKHRLHLELARLLERLFPEISATSNAPAHTGMTK